MYNNEKRTKGTAHSYYSVEHPDTRLHFTHPS